MFLSNTEAAEQLDLSPARIRQLCVRGQFPGALKVGRNWIIPSDAIDQYAENRRGVGHPERHAMQPVQLESGRWILAAQDQNDGRRYYVALDADDRKRTGCHTVYGSIKYVAGLATTYPTREAAEAALSES